ncbi:hypothetical protein GCM10010254_35370 [Streptomyces chromofuscus]|nr:hypothetical protein GCM10010254_35370 [Streptomyces chromofuscus]
MVAAGLATPGVSHAQQRGEAQPPQVGRIDAADPSATAPLIGTSALAVDSGEQCEPTPARSKERRAGAAEACVSVSPAPARSTATRQKTLAAAADAGSCDLTHPGSYSYERFSYCVTGINVTYVLRDTNGAELGRGVLEVSTGGDLSATATTWSEQVSVTMVGATGQVTALNAKFRASCDAGCTATKSAPWYGGGIALGQTLTGTVTYSSPRTTGSSASFFTSYAMYVTSPGATATDPNASWRNARQIRCDDAVGGTSVAGCAVPSVMAVVPMKATSADAGGAVAAYGWAQNHLDGAWGKTGRPLTRSTSGVAGRTAATCGGFTAQPELVDTDTCADFPFGEAKEGGAPGDRCVEVIPNLGNGEWDTYIFNDSRDMDPAAPCVQSHVTPAEKQFADAQLADGFRDQRVIEADQFELAVSTPDTGPQARCLNDPPPAGSIPNGDGWFKNTTEPVPLIQQTVPADGAGLRPTQAQACLGKGIGRGTGTQKEITGWKDAEAFKAANNVTSGLSRCHLIASILGGKGTTLVTKYNLVPCWQSGMNTGTPSMRTYESMAQSMVKDPASSLGVDDAIFYQVTPVYRDANSTIPVGVTMNATVERVNGATEQLFPNVFIPNTLADTLQYNLGN